MRALSVAGARAGTKGLVGFGLVAGGGGGALAVAADAPTDLTPLGLDDGTATAASLGARDGGVASRSAGRAPAPIVAPERSAASAPVEYGEIGVEAVAKPTPEPEPEPTPEPTVTEQAIEEPSSEPTAEPEPEPEPTAEPEPDVVDTGSYAAEAAALGLGPNASQVYSAVRTAFPSLTNIGGYRAGDPGDHGSGRAVDIMCGTADGDALAAYLQAHAGELNIKYIIWKQRIWYPGGGWEWMEDRGSVTANHYDHVHVSVY